MQLQLAYKAVKVLEKANSTAQGNLKLVENYFKTECCKNRFVKRSSSCE